MYKLEGLSRAHTSPTDLELSKFNHLFPCDRCRRTHNLWSPSVGS